MSEKRIKARFENKTATMELRMKTKNIDNFIKIGKTFDDTCKEIEEKEKRGED
jgi:hypothetical protein